MSGSVASLGTNIDAVAQQNHTSWWVKALSELGLVNH